MNENTMSNNKGSVMVLNLRNYATPVITENSGRKWVEYGEDNNYFGYLHDRYMGSPTNQALINGISDMIVGKGLVSEQMQLLPEMWEQVNNLFSYEDLKKWAFDLKSYGFYMQQVILSEDLSKIAKVKHTPVELWRSGVADEKGNVNTFWYSDNWEQRTNPRFRPESYPAYKKGTREKLSILAVKPYRSGSFYYPSVDYQGCLQYAHIEEEISNFHINNLLNGMFPGLLVNFNNGIPDETTRNEIEAKIKEKWGQTSNTGKVIIAWNDDKERSATVESVNQADLDKMFDLLNTQATEKIMIGHRVVSPALFGVKTNMGLGNNADELRVASILFEKTVLVNYRELMIRNINELLLVNGVKLPLEFDSTSPFENFPSYQQPDINTPQKMDISSGTTLNKEYKHIPLMSEQAEKAYLEAINPYGENVNLDDWFEVDVSKVEDEETEDNLFKNNGNNR